MKNEVTTCVQQSTLIDPQSKTIAALSRYSGIEIQTLIDRINDIAKYWDCDQSENISFTIDNIEITLVPDIFGEFPYILYFKLPDSFNDDMTRTIRYGNIAVPADLNASYIYSSVLFRKQHRNTRV